MERSNFKQKNLFLSKSIYQTLPISKPFLQKINEFINWYELASLSTSKFNNLYSGQKAIHPVVLIKILFLQRIYDLSDREVEETCTDSISIKRFLELEINEKSPDHTTISKFRSFLVNNMEPDYLENIFYSVLEKIQEKGVKLGSIYAVDSTITDADVNTHKDKKRQKEDKKQPRDKDASFTAKTRISKKTGERYTKFYYGYKSHTMVDTKSNIVTAVEATKADTSDLDKIIPLVNKSRFNKCDVQVVTADKAYDDAVTIGILEKDQGIFSCIKTKVSRVKRSSSLESNEYWDNYANNELRKKILRRRGIVERCYADTKINHGLGRCKYLGYMKYKYQSMLTFIIHNLKLGINKLYGIKIRDNSLLRA